MGRAYKLECTECQFESVILHGRGRINVVTAYGYCRECNEVISEGRNVTSEQVIQAFECHNNHKHILEPLQLEEQKNEFGTGKTLTRVKCPKCQNADLNLIFYGHWD
jgi:ribosomal protein S27E